MNPLSLSVHPKDVTTKILKTLSNKRGEEVLAKRFGLRAGKRETLEAIGKSYGITRERVRQIEEAALKSLSESALVRQELAHFGGILKDQLMRHGGVSEEKRFFNSVADERYHPHLHFLLLLAKTIERGEADDSYHNRWFVDHDARRKSEAVVGGVVEEFRQKGQAVSENELRDAFSRHAREVFGQPQNPEAVRSVMSITSMVQKNPFGEYGLVDWPQIHPRGVRDKAYVVLAKASKPLHFTEVAKHITKAGWSRRAAHPQTVHNELIKDNRFVLVGRGLYALKEWGYEPGTVKDVLVSVMRSAGKPLTKEEIVKRVMEKRLVKENTILLNLQEKKKFKRVGGDGYTLV